MTKARSSSADNSVHNAHTSEFAEHALNRVDRNTFRRHRNRLAKFDGDWQEKSKILRDIRDRSLFREEWRTFEIFCRKELEMGRSNVNRLLQCAEVATFLATNVATPKREAHVRPLLRLGNDKQRATAFRHALEDAKTEDKNLTAALVNRAVKDLREKPISESNKGPTKADVMTRICRSLARGLEKLEIQRLKEFETAVAEFKDTWLQAQSNNADIVRNQEVQL